MNEHTVSKLDAGLRLDKWLKSRLPGLPFGLTQKLLRKGAIKINGKRAKADARVNPGDIVRVPELENATKAPIAHAPRPPRAEEATLLLDNIIYRDENIIAINKPQGLSTQGGSKVFVSVDALLDHVRFEATERPKLVHRIDKDTSGVLILARNRLVAGNMMEAFQSKTIRKIYYAVVVGVPDLAEGRIEVKLSGKKAFGRIEKASVDEENGQYALTYYKVLDKAAGKKLAWVMLMPVTGRMHQLRVHMEHIGHPILGDGKYGGRDAFIEGLGETMHLHSRRAILPDGTDIEAPFPKHITDTLKLFEFGYNQKELRREEKEMLEQLENEPPVKQHKLRTKRKPA